MRLLHARRILSLAFGLAALSALGCEDSSATAAPDAPDGSGGPKGASGAAKPATKVAAKVDAVNYAVELEAPGPYKAGEKAEAKVVLVPKGVYKINDEYPMKLKLSDADGVTYDKATLKKSDFEYSPKKGSFSVSFTPAETGKAKLSGTMSMSVCSEENCLIEKVSLEKVIEVE